MKKIRNIVNGELHIIETKKHAALWGKKNFALYDDEFKRARSRMIDKLDCCFCCCWPFQLNKDHVNLVAFSGVGNKCVCDECFEELDFVHQIQETEDEK